MSAPGLVASARRILPLAWPVFIGQLAVVAFSTMDTMMVGRHSALDLAALAIGGAAYITIFVGSMGVVLAIGPITGQLFGARRLPEAGRQFQQALWLALMLSVPGFAALFWPDPFLWLARATPEVAERVRGYLAALAFALPPALLFTAFRGFNTAVSRPKVVMLLQVAALLLKLPLNAVLVFGVELPALGLRTPSLGAPGCGIATAIVTGAQWLAAWTLWRRDPFYADFGLHGRHRAAPDGPSLAALLRLGIPMGLAIGIEVTGFTFMAFFISRLGATAVAGHQIAVNLVSLMFMMPLALANATSTLVAQHIGAGDRRDARRTGWHGLQLGVGVSAAVGAAVYLAREPIVRTYTGDDHRDAAARLGDAVPRRRRGADAGRLHAARLPDRHRADADLRHRDLGHRPRRRLHRGLRPHRLDAAGAARRDRLLVGRDGRAQRRRRGAGGFPGVGAAAAARPRAGGGSRAPRRRRLTVRPPAAARSRSSSRRPRAPRNARCRRGARRSA